MNEASDADAPLRKDLALAARHRALTRVAPGLVHELRGPLNAVHLNLELSKTLAGSVEGEAGDKLRGYLGVVEEELDRFQERFDRFLEQVFPPGERDAERVDLRRTVEDVEDLLKVQARKERVTLEVEVPDEPIVVEGKPGLLRDALLQMAVYGLGDETAGEPGALRLSLATTGQEARLAAHGPRSGIDWDDPLAKAARISWESQGGTVTASTGEAGGIFMHMPYEREPRTR